MSEHPPKLKKPEAYVLTDLDGIKLDPDAMPKSETISKPEIETESAQTPFIETERTLGRLNSAPDSLGEFRRNMGGLFEKMKSLRAVSGKEARASVPLSERPLVFPKGLNLNHFNEAEEEQKYADQEAKKKAEAEAGKADELKSISEAVELAKKAGVHESHEKIHEVEKRYADLYGKFYSPDNALFRSKHGKEFRKVSEEYHKAKFEHVTALQESVEKRLDTPERTAKLQEKFNKIPDKLHTYTFEKFKAEEDQKIIQRYNGWIRYKEVFKTTADLQLNARVENLDEKGKGLFSKFAEGYQKWNADLEHTYGVTEVRAARLLVTTAIATGIAIPFGAIGAGGVAAYAAFRLGRGALTMVGGMYAAGLGGKAFKETIGKDTAKKREASHGQKITSEKDLSRVQSLQVHGSEAGIEANRKKVETTIAMLVGAGVGFAAGHMAHAATGTEASWGKGFIHTPPPHAPELPKTYDIPPEKPSVSGLGHGHIEKPHLTTHHHTNHHLRFAHHPHAAAGHEESSAHASNVEPDRSAEIAKIEQAEITGHGLNSPDAHAAYDSAITHAQAEYSPAPAVASEHVVPVEPAHAETPPAPAPSHDAVIEHSQPTIEHTPALTADHPSTHNFDNHPNSVHTESWINSNRTFIDMRSPNLYMNGSANHELVMYGGSWDDQVKAANNFLDKPENFGKSVWIDHLRINAITNTPERIVYQFTTDANGVPTQIPYRLEDGALPVINPETFTKPK